ncbi:MAG: hypothetical protein FJX69_08945, partial [Alphaproteobacteria bacterium]|nr:hypothetical protein [Alphaproteobacteria bacterium]
SAIDAGAELVPREEVLVAPEERKACVAPPVEPSPPPVEPPPPPLAPPPPFPPPRPSSASLPLRSGFSNSAKLFPSEVFWFWLLPPAGSAAGVGPPAADWMFAMALAMVSRREAMVPPIETLMNSASLAAATRTICPPSGPVMTTLPSSNVVWSRDGPASMTIVSPADSRICWTSPARRVISLALSPGVPAIPRLPRHLAGSRRDRRKNFSFTTIQQDCPENTVDYALQPA